MNLNVCILTDIHMPAYTFKGIGNYGLKDRTQYFVIWLLIFDPAELFVKAK